MAVKTSEQFRYNSKDVAVCLRAHKKDICNEWQEQTRKRLGAAKLQTKISLLDHIPQFLDNLAEAFDEKMTFDEIFKSANIGREHGEQRADTGDYNLREVLLEYRLLRKILVGTLKSHCFVDEDVEEVIHEFVDRGMTEAADRFIECTNESLNNAKFAAEAANAAKSSFLANMSHEIRTPLGAIVGFVELLNQNNLSTEETAEYTGVIARNSHHLSSIVDDILDLTKVEAGKMIVEKVSFSLSDVVADLSSLMAFRAREKGIDFEVISKVNVPRMIVSDSTRIRQILHNVIGNAVKFTDAGRVELKISFNEPFIEFLVTDSGRGISVEQATQLFQPFSQADASTTRRFGGTGLGLVLTRRLCQALGGDFHLKSSELGKGSVFCAYIRVDLDHSDRNADAPLRSANPDFSGKKILLVEDSPDNQALVRILLTKLGAEVDVAVNGAQGVDKALAGNYDTVLMDVQMPTMDGYEATQILRKKKFDKPIIALTAHAMKEERKKCLESGFTAFLTKPIHRPSLIALLESYGAKREEK